MQYISPHGGLTCLRDKVFYDLMMWAMQSSVMQNLRTEEGTFGQ